MTIPTAPCRSRLLLRATLLGAALAAMLAAPVAFGVTQVKTSTAGALNAGASWVSTTAPGSGDIGQFSSTTGGAQSDTVGTGGLIIGELQLTNPTGTITINDQNAANYLTINGLSGVGIDMSTALHGLTINAGITLGGSQNWNIVNGQTLTVSGTQGINLGANVLTIGGGGQVNFTFANTAGTFTRATSSTGAGIIVNGSFMDTQITSNGASSAYVGYLGNNTALTMDGSTLIAGEAGTTGNNEQNYTSLTVGAGASTGNVTGRGSSSGQSIGFVAVNRNAGGIMDFAAAGGSTAFGGSNQGFALAGTGVNGWATIGGNDWAVAQGATTFTKTPVYVNDTWAGTNNTTVTVSSSPTASSTTKDLRFNNAGAFTVTLSGTNTISTGGILIGSTAGANTETITGGSLTSGDTNSDSTHDLVIVNNNTSGGNLVINSNLVDNGANSVGLTIGIATNATGVTGNVSLGGTNTFTGPSYIDGGSVILTSSGAWGGASALNFAPRDNMNFASASGTFTMNGNSITVNGLNTTQSGGTFNPTVQNANASAATLTVNLPSGSDSFNGTIKDGTGGGSLSLVSSGAGTETLSGVLSYSGSTSVTAGDVVLKSTPSATTGFSVNGTLDVTNIGVLTIGSGKTLSGTGTVLGSVTLSSGSTTTPGGASNVGLLTIGSLTMNASSTTTFDFGSGVNDEITTTTALNFNSTGGLFDLVTLAGSPVTTDGNYTLFNYGSGSVGSFSNLTISSILNPAGGLSYTFNNNTGSDNITLLISGQADNLATWTNGSGSAQNWSTAANWYNGTGNLSPSHAGDSATFADTSPNPTHTVVLDTSESVGTVIFNSNSTYNVTPGTSTTLTFDNGGLSATITDSNGNDTISTPMSLNSNLAVAVAQSNQTLSLSGGIADGGTHSFTMSGTGAGTVDLTGTNVFNGGMFLNGGVLDFTSGSLGSTLITFGGGTLQWAPGNTQDISSSYTLDFAAGGAVLDPGSNTITLASPIGNGDTGGLTKVGAAGTLILAANNTFSGPVNVNAGTLQFSNITVAGSPSNLGTGSVINFNGGSLQWASGTSTDISTDTVTFQSGGGTLDTNGNSVTLANSIGNGGSGGLTKAGNGNLFLDAVETYTGSTTVNGGTLDLGVSNAIPASSLIVGSSGVFNMAGFNQSENTLGGTGTINFGSGGATLTVGGSISSSTFPGSVIGTGTFTKAGTGTLTLSGTSSAIGTVNVNAGTLEFDPGANWSGATGVNNNGGVLYVHGGNLTSSGTFALSSFTYNQDSGSATFGTVSTNTGTDGALFNITGGNFTATTIDLGRTNAYQTAPTATAPISAVTTNGFYVNGSTANVSIGTLAIGVPADNSSTSARLDAGNITVTGPVLVGNTASGSRWSILQVNGGNFNSTDDLVMGENAGTTLNNAEMYLSGGTLTAQEIDFGALSDTVGGTSWLILGTTGTPTGTLYVGSGGITQPNTTGLTANIVLTHGLLGATANWSSSLAMQLAGNATSFSIQAADSSGVAHNITLSGTISGAGALNKTGNGILTLSGPNSYTGATTISAGTVSVGANAPSGSAGAFGNAASAVILGDAGTTTNNSSPSVLIAGAFTVARPITVASQATSGTYSIGGSTDNPSTFSGAITMNEPLTVTQVANTGSNALNISGGINNVGTNTVTFNNIGNVSVNTAGMSGGTLSVVQSGAGVTSFAVANTYSGTTTINAGTIALSGAGSLGSGNVILGGGTFDISAATSSSYTLGSSQTLSGTGTVKATGGTLTINGGLSPTLITVSAGGATLGSTSASTFNVASLSTYSKFILSSGLLTYGGSLGVNFGTQTGFGTFDLYSSTSQAGDFTAVTIAGSYAASLTDSSGVWTGTDMTNGVDFSFSDLTGQLVLTAVPEPGVYALVLGGVALLAGLRRRKHSRNPTSNSIPHDQVKHPHSSSTAEVL